MKLKSKIFENRSGPCLLITGGVHGDEFEPIAAVRRLISILENNTSIDIDLWGRVQLVPVVNEPAFLRGHRVATEDELDLARTCPGKPAGSITERAAHAVSELINDADFYIDLHTGGTELSVFPLTGYQLVDDPNILETQRKMAHAFNLPFVWGTHPKCDGRTLSVARDAGVPAIYAEYLGSATMSEDGVEAYLDGCLNVMGLLGMIERDEPESRVRWVVENDRPDSGNMQICNPSPITGFFEPAVQLGDIVDQGQRLGTVYDQFGGGDFKHVYAAESGIVLVLRTFPRVRKGETIGVIEGID